MASKNDVIIQVIADTKQAVSGMAKMAAGIGVAIVAVKKLGKVFIDTLSFAAQIETQKIAFQTLLGDADKANELFKEITEFSASTPFQLDNLTRASQQLLAFGTASEDVIDKLRMLGNAASGDSIKLERLTLAFGKVQAKGRASLEEINMFTEAGVPLMRALGENLNLTNEELFKFISAGKVGFKEVDDALCLSCAGFDDMEFLASGDATLTRRARKFSERCIFIKKTLLNIVVI